jgi:hypothetical protein
VKTSSPIQCYEKSRFSVCHHHIFRRPERRAQSTNATQVELHVLVQKVQEKIMAGKTAETDLADELKDFDKLTAAERGAKTDEAAQIVYMKAMLYIEVFNEPDKGAEIIKQIKADYPDTKYGKRANEMLASLDKQAASKKI